MGVELGFVGLAIFVMGFLMWGQDVRDIFRNALNPKDRAFTVGLLGSVLAILAHGTVDSVFHEPALVVVLVICGGLVLSFRPKNVEQGSQWTVLLSYSRTRAAGVIAFGIVLGILVFQPAVGWYLNGRGEDEEGAGRHGRALEWFERASFIDPGTTGYHDAIARTSVQLFHQSDDLRWLMTAIEQELVASALNPLDGRFPYRLGTIYALLADQKLAEKQRDVLLGQAGHAYEEAMRVDPFSPFNYFELGRIRIAQGRLEEGKDWLRKGILIEPNFLPARVLSADLSLRSGFRQEAQSSYEAILEIKKRYEKRTLSTMEQQFLDVDLYPLGRALAVGAHS
jgi:tetratricopeptide (TPR) repeat protein